MSNERINVHYINAELNTIWDKTKEKDFPPMNRHMAYGTLVDKLLAELKKCYEEIDEYDKLVGLLIRNHFVETDPYETVKHLIETHQDYRASE